MSLITFKKQLYIGIKLVKVRNISEISIIIGLSLNEKYNSDIKDIAIL